MAMAICQSGCGQAAEEVSWDADREPTAGGGIVRGGARAKADERRCRGGIHDCGGGIRAGTAGGADPQRAAIQFSADWAAAEFDLCSVRGVCSAAVLEFCAAGEFVDGGVSASRSFGGDSAVSASGVLRAFATAGGTTSATDRAERDGFNAADDGADSGSGATREFGEALGFFRAMYSGTVAAGRGAAEDRGGGGRWG